jgi:hypothetical protein
MEHLRELRIELHYDLELWSKVSIHYKLNKSLQVMKRPEETSLSIEKSKRDSSLVLVIV